MTNITTKIAILIFFVSIAASPAASGLTEVGLSISPATVEQWSKYSFSIELENPDAEDIRLDPNTELRFGMGTGDTYTANLTEEVVIPAGGTETLTFERAPVCAESLPAEIYHPQLELTGVYVNSGTPYSQTLDTQANPITVTYMELQWVNSIGISPGLGKYLVHKNGGWLHKLPSPSGTTTWQGSMRQNVPGEMRWQFPDTGDPGFDFDMRLDPKYIEQDNTSIIDFESNPPYKVWMVFIDNHNDYKQSRVQFAVYPRVDTLLNHRYEGRISMGPQYIYPHCYGGILIGTAAAYDIFFDENVDLDIASIGCSAGSLSYGEVLDVNLTVQNMKVYPIRLDLTPEKTYLTFTSGGYNVGSFFQVTHPTGSMSIPGSATETITFSVTQISAAPLSMVTIDPTISYYNYFADGNGVITLSGKDTGSLYLMPVTATFDVNCALAGDVYVNVAAPPEGNGASWETAYQTIQAGIDAAGYGEKVWVTYGTYHEAIVMKSDIQLYGGFAGNESTLIERDIMANPTIIDASTADSNSPADHVVVMDGITNARIDGFTITGGAANGVSPDDKGGGIYCKQLDTTNTLVNSIISGNSSNDRGGGVYCDNSSLNITNCIICRNSAPWGGGLYYFDSSPSTTNCTISSNTAFGYGGGVFCRSRSPLFIKCTISGNSASSRGGGVYCDGSSSPSLTNCAITGNWSDLGGGVYYYASSSPITNCTISGNKANSVGGVYCDNSSPPITNTIFEDNAHRAIYEDDDDSDPTVAYCLFYNNPDGDYYDYETGVQTGANNINANVAGAHDNIDGDPLFVMNGDYGVTGTWTQDPNYDANINRTTLTDANALFAEGELVGKLINADITEWLQAVILANTSTTIDVLGDTTGYVSAGDTYEILDYHIQSSSPCVDAGTDSGAPPKDLAGGPRPVDIPGIGTDETATEYDIGAYEAQICDYDFDGDVDFRDYAFFAAYWMSAGCDAANQWCQITDLDLSTIVNSVDLGVLAEHWLEGTTP